MKQYNSKYVNVSITITPEQIARMNILGKDRSQYIRRLIEMDLYSDEEIEKKQQELKEEDQMLEKLKGRNREEEAKIELNSNWVPYLENAKAVIEKDRGFLEGQTKGFNNHFGEDITIEEFEKLLEKVKSRLQEFRG